MLEHTKEKNHICVQYVGRSLLRLVRNMLEDAQERKISCPSDFALNKAEKTKICKYQELKMQCKRLWKYKDVSIIPIIVRATRSLKINLIHWLKIEYPC